MVTANLLFCVQHPYDSDYCGKEHQHPCYEVVYYLEGRGKVAFSEKEYHFKKDTFMVCMPEVKHIEEGEKGTVVLYIGFELFGEISLKEGLFRESDYGIKEYLEKIYYETKNWTSISYQLINLYCSIIALKLTSRNAEDAETVIDHNLDNIVGYISAHFQEDLSVRKLAQMVGYSYDHFRKTFFKKFNITVNDFILKKRIDAANDMLKNKRFPIKQVAASCGFSSPAQFCTKYREITGITPKRMQKIIEQNEQSIGIDRLS